MLAGYFGLGQLLAAALQELSVLVREVSFLHNGKILHLKQVTIHSAH